MNTHRCCEVASDPCPKPFTAPGAHGELHSPTFTRRCLDIACWIVLGAILTLMPKCPACLAAYVAIATGVGLSLSTATHLRASLLILSLALLLFLVVRRLRRFADVKEDLLRVKSRLHTLQAKENAL